MSYNGKTIVIGVRVVGLIRIMDYKDCNGCKV